MSSTDAYAQRFAGPAGAYLLTLQNAALLSLLERFGPSLRILDVGGGHAQIAPALARLGHRVTVLSSHPECETRARRLCDGLGVRFLTGRLDHPLPSTMAVGEGYDVVVALRMTMHMPDWTGFIAGLCGLGPRGVIIDYPSWRSTNALEPWLFGVKQRSEGGGTRRYRLFRPGQVGRAFRSRGYRVSASRHECFLPLVVHRRLGCPGLTRPFENVARALGLTRLIGSPVLALAERVGEPPLAADASDQGEVAAAPEPGQATDPRHDPQPDPGSDRTVA
ncbi:MAG: methyltransferase domain-containing protein [Planctomycetota bacterium]